MKYEFDYSQASTADGIAVCTVVPMVGTDKYLNDHTYYTHWMIMVYGYAGHDDYSSTSIYPVAEDLSSEYEEPLFGLDHMGFGEAYDQYIKQLAYAIDGELERMNKK